jgi:hypothetical protein
LLLLALVSIKTLLVPVVYLDFELRKDYIVQHLCENRFKPELHCDGKCYLAKTLSKIAEEKAQNEAERQSHNIKKVLEEVFDDQLFITSLTEIFEVKTTTLFSSQSRPLADYSPALLRPPAFV